MCSKKGPALVLFDCRLSLEALRCAQTARFYCCVLTVMIVNDCFWNGECLQNAMLFEELAVDELFCFRGACRGRVFSLYYFWFPLRIASILSGASDGSNGQLTVKCARLQHISQAEAVNSGGVEDSESVSVQLNKVETLKANSGWGFELRKDKQVGVAYNSVCTTLIVHWFQLFCRTAL